MKPQRTLWLAAAALIALAACNNEKEDNGKETKTSFLDVNVTFKHVRVSPAEGQKLTVSLYTSDVAGKEVAALTAARTESVTLTAAQASAGLRVTFDNLDRSAGHLYVFAYVDIDADSQVSDGDLASWLGGTPEDVAEGKATPTDVNGEYAVNLKVDALIGEGEFIVPDGFVADFDKNLYTIVTVGPHFWTGENLRTTHFQDGTEITVLMAGDNIGEYSTPAVVNAYPNDEALSAKMGYYYNWYAASEKNPCPEGWRIPSDDDWLDAERYIAPRATDLGVDHTDAPQKNAFRGASENAAVPFKTAEMDFGGDNSTGLNFYPAGIYDAAVAKGYDADTKICVIWTTDSYPSLETNAVRRFFQHNQAGIGRGTDKKNRGQSLRCIKDNPDYVKKTPLKAPELTVEGTVVSWAAVEGASAYMVSVNGEEEIAVTATSFDVASVKEAQAEDKTYTVTVYATGDETLYTPSPVASANVTITGVGGDEKQYVKDYDGNEYEIVTIGTQTWMREHLRTTRFQDGTAISKLEGDAFKAATDAAYVNPFSEEEVKTFGYLYNWYAATEKNPCPSGYHVPSDDEFLILERYISGNESLDADKSQADFASNVYREADSGLGTAMKTSDYSFGGADDSAFNAMPAGTYSNALSKHFSASTKICVLWTTTTFEAKEANAMRRMFQHNQKGSGRGSAAKVAGQSIRCVKDSE